jgi:NO-binding membrane sensor protein with MHYT domain
MYKVFTCLTVEHDWRLVVLAGAVCFLASGVAISLFHRAQATMGRARFVWLTLDAAAAGCGRLTSSRCSRMILALALATILV